jgi:ABC-type multidrug transport system ATPase subunit
LIYAGKLIADDTPANIKKMITGDLLEIAPADFVAARDLVASLDCVKELQTYGDKLHVFVDNEVSRKPEIESALATHGIQHEEIRKIEVRMEEAFISLIRQREEK